MDAGGGGAITYASAAGAGDVIELLQKRGAKPAGLDLMLAAEGCHTAAAGALIAGGVNPNAEVNGSLPLLTAAGGNCVDTVTLLLARRRHQRQEQRRLDGADQGVTSGNMTDVVRVLLAHGADMDVADKLDRTA